MIFLRKLNGERFVLNPDLIEMVSENPDTTILLTNGKHLIVRETMDEVVEKYGKNEGTSYASCWAEPAPPEGGRKKQKRKGYNRLWTFCRLLV